MDQMDDINEQVLTEDSIRHTDELQPSKQLFPGATMGTPSPPFVDKPTQGSHSNTMTSDEKLEVLEKKVQGLRSFYVGLTVALFASLVATFSLGFYLIDSKQSLFLQMTRDEFVREEQERDKQIESIRIENRELVKETREELRREQSRQLEFLKEMRRTMEK